MKKAIIHQHYPLDYAGEEALNSICTNLAFIGTDKRKIVITSNSQSEGKSWMTMHIAENMARRGRHVVLVDADMRRSFMVQRYKLELEGEGLGLAHFLAGQCDLNDVVYESDVYGMCLIPAGRDVVNPINLIDSSYFEQMLEALAQSFDMVIVDAPPVGMVIDAAESRPSATAACWCWSITTPACAKWRNASGRWKNPVRRCWAASSTKSTSTR